MILRIRKWETVFENAESRKLKTLKWVAMPNKMNTQGYTALVDHPNAAAHLGAWCAIVEICSAREPKELRGTLPEADGTIGGICRVLGRISRLPSGIFQELLPRLIQDPEISWIEQLPSISGESPDLPGNSPDVPGRKGRGGEGIEGNRTEEEIPQPPSGALFDSSQESGTVGVLPSVRTLRDVETLTTGTADESTIAVNSQGVVRSDVSAKKKKPVREMSAEQRGYFRSFLELHPKNKIQTASAEKLWYEKVTTPRIAKWLIDTLERECAGNTTFMFGPGKWLADHLTLYANGVECKTAPPMPQTTGTNYVMWEPPRD